MVGASNKYHILFINLKYLNINNVTKNLFQMNEKELNAIINLLDDPDDNIFNTLQDKLIEQGTDVISKLEDAWEKSPDASGQDQTRSPGGVFAGQSSGGVPHERDHGDRLPDHELLRRSAFPRLGEHCGHGCDGGPFRPFDC